MWNVLVSKRRKFNRVCCRKQNWRTKGDKVIIEKGENGKLQGALLVFLVPLLLIGLSVILGLYVIKWELSVLILSGSLIILWYIILSIIDKKLKYLNSFKSVIVEIVKEQ